MKRDRARQRGSQAAGCDSEPVPIGFHRLIAKRGEGGGGAATDEK